MEKRKNYVDIYKKVGNILIVLMVWAHSLHRFINLNTKIFSHNLTLSSPLSPSFVSIYHLLSFLSLLFLSFFLFLSHTYTIHLFLSLPLYLFQSLNLSLSLSIDLSHTYIHYSSISLSTSFYLLFVSFSHISI